MASLMKKTTSAKPKTFQIKRDEIFPTLALAPITEAVIHWQAEATVDLKCLPLRELLAERFPAYPQCDSQHGMHVAMRDTQDGQPEFSQRLQWSGLRLRRENPNYIVQFTRKYSPKVWFGKLVSA